MYREKTNSENCERSSSLQSLSSSSQCHDPPPQIISSSPTANQENRRKKSLSFWRLIMTFRTSFESKLTRIFSSMQRKERRRKITFWRGKMLFWRSKFKVQGLNIKVNTNFIEYENQSSLTAASPFGGHSI